MIYWLIQFKRVAIFGALAIILCIGTIFKYVQFSKEETDFPKNNIKITSYNSMLFDLYNWRKNDSTRNEILSYLNEIRSNILCLQEFYTSEEEGDYDNTKTLSENLNFQYHHVEYTSTLREKDHWGIGTFSKFPIINKGKILFKTKSNNLCIYSDIVTPIDTFRVYNVHLQSISFSKKDVAFLKQIKEGTEVDEIENSKNVLRRIKRATVKRAAQVDIIRLHMKNCPYKIILCGDFNDPPASYTYNELTGNLNDAYLEKGFGLGQTYNGEWPQFRIDYILYDKSLRCASYKPFKESLTDHYPITAVLY